MFNHFISLNTSRKNVIFRLRYTSKYVLNTSYFSEPFSAAAGYIPISSIYFLVLQVISKFCVLILILIFMASRQNAGQNREKR